MVVSGVSTFLGSQKGINVSGISTFTDNVELKLGSAGEVRLLHNGSATNFIISQHFFNMQANGYNFLSQNGSENIITAFQNGAVNLFFDNTKRFETTNTGAVVTGILTATSNVNVGSGVTLSPDGDIFAVGVSTFTDEIHLTTTGNTLRFKDDSGNQTGAIAGNSSNLGFFGHANGNGRFDFYTGGAYRFRIQPGGDINVGTAVTIGGVTGNARYTGIITATSFVGDLTGDVTGTASNATLAVSAQGLTGSPNITVTNINAVDTIISGNLSVAGTITSLDQNDISVTGIMTASAGVDLGDPGVVTLSSDTLTTTSTNADTISSISATVFRSATFQVQVTRGTQYHMTTINVIHNGTVAFMSEYGTIRTGAVLATFDADISGGNLRLRATPTSADSTVFKLSKTTIKV